MYGLPKEVDLSFFTDKELMQVAVGLYDVQLHFDESVSLSVQHRIEHSSKEGSVIWEQEETPPTSASSLLALIGLRVTSARGDTDGTLTIQLRTQT